jgi:tetratricopeptide (TPR) repeat protein
MSELDESRPSSAFEAGTPLTRGDPIGRYVVLGVLGRGGMGDVYAAYDPELNRKVAVKVLRARVAATGHRPDSRARRLREAQAIAKLSHPNVVLIFDVGAFGDTVFLAMEFIEGATVEQWRTAAPRRWREILRVFLAAGHGLGAAHAAGLIHHGFKPDNVMVGRDGQVRVMDFGVARQAGHTTSDAEAMEPAQPPFADAPSPVDPEATRSGPTPGTPAYIAPERRTPQAASTSIAEASADQFSYCVALYETLYGRRPPALEARPGAGPRRVPDPPADRVVPPWIRKILARGLSPTPEDRYPSMNELLAALEKDPAVARRRALTRAATGLAVLAVAVLALTAGRRLGGARAAVCEGAGARVADVWEAGGLPSPRKDAIRAAFAATGKSYAQHAFDSARGALDRYVADWMTIYRDACQATAVRHQQTAEVLDLRMSCLNSHLDEVRALTDLFLRADGQVVDKATSAAQALTPLERCSDLAILRAVIKPPDDPAVRARVNRIRQGLAVVKAMQSAGLSKDALARANVLVAEARAIGYQPLLAEALTRVGWLSMGMPMEADAIFSEAAFTAAASGDHELFAEAAIAQALTVGFLEGQPDRARTWIGLADSTLNRIGGHDVLRAWLINNQGAVVYSQGHYAEALEFFRRSTALKEKLLGPEAPDVATSLGNMGEPLAKLGRFDEALAVNQRALQILESNGNDQESLANYLGSRADYLNAAGRFAAATPFALRAVEIGERQLGPNNAYLAYSLQAVGVSYLGQDRAHDAIDPLTRAYDLRTRLDPEPSRLGETAFALAQALWRSHRDRARARALAQQAEGAYARTVDGKALAGVRAWLATRAQRHGNSLE